MQPSSENDVNIRCTTTDEDVRSQQDHNIIFPRKYLTTSTENNVNVNVDLYTNFISRTMLHYPRGAVSTCAHTKRMDKSYAITLCDDTLYRCNKIVGLLENSEGNFTIYLNTIHSGETKARRHYINLRWNKTRYGHWLYNASCHYETRMIAFINEFYMYIKMLKRDPSTNIFVTAKMQIYKHFASVGYLLEKPIFKIIIHIFCYKTFLDPQINDYTLGYLCCP